ncbi:unnamed protein product [Brachionus calyciflorus]|uniref:Integrase catalytic domain-containing protein n=1 Tax=Brachionus calyciflorus TaxID=104777 RepID=A0A814Q3Q3_9BILA|nr:unnamed protein product [Brachionus calyciflorus]
MIEDKIKYYEDNLLKSINPIVLSISKSNKNNQLQKFIKGNCPGLTQPNRQIIRVGECIRKVDKSGRTIFYLVTQHSQERPDIKNIEKCLYHLHKHCEKYKITDLAFPKTWTSLGWHKISKLINEILINNGINCSVFKNVENTDTDCTDSELSIDNSIMKLQNTDRDISQLLFKVKNNQIKGFQIENNVLFKLRRQKNGKLFKQLVVPKELKLDILKMCHDNFTGAHLGQRKTWIKLNNRFYWQNSYQDTKNYVESCGVCSRIKDPPVTRAELKPITEFQKPFDMVAVDILELTRTNSGNKYVVVFTDYLTKWVEAFPLRDQNAESIAKIFINEIISRHSAPSKLLSDQGRNFLSNLIKSICQYFKINKVQTSPYHPQCDGLVERFNKTLCKMLSAYSNSNQTNWDLYLPLVLFAYRTSQQATTSFSPFELLYGREPRLGDLDNYNLGYEPSEFIKNLHENWLLARTKIIKQAKINKLNYDSKYKLGPPKYKIGEEVRIKLPQTKIGLKPKLRNDKWSEPRKIRNVITAQNVSLEPDGKIVNVNNIKKKEPKRNAEFIRSSPQKTRFGRTTKPRYKIN